VASYHQPRREYRGGNNELLAIFAQHSPHTDRGKVTWCLATKASNCSGRNMQMLCLRNIPFIDADSLVLGEAKEALFRDPHGFLLYLSKNPSSASNEERIFRLEAREALIWLNEAAQDQGSFWG
jgi:hypothetical protein